MNLIYPISFSLAVFLIITIIGIIKSPTFPKISSVNILFRECFLTGRTSGIMGTYKNILEVVVTDQELWIRPFLPFFPFAAIVNAIHQAPLTAIQGIETRRSETTIYFINGKGTKVHFSIYFKNPQAFIQSIEQLNKSVKVQAVH